MSEPTSTAAGPTSRTRIPYLYVTGASYSGSTLLAFLLNAHPEIATLSEAHGPIAGLDFETYACSCGELLLKCPFYERLAARMRALGIDFDLRQWRTAFRMSRKRWLDIPMVRPLRNALLEDIRDQMVPFVPGYRRTIEQTSLRNAHLAQAVLELTGARVFADLQKDSMRVKFLNRIERLDLKVIHLVRDARSGTASFMKNKSMTDPARAARMWLIANENAWRARRYVRPEQWLHLTYDALTADPQETYNRITDFIGVSRYDLPEDFYACEHHIIGNRMRLRGGGGIRRDESWRKSLDEAAIETIARVAGKANHKFGFDWP